MPSPITASNGGGACGNGVTPTAIDDEARVGLGAVRGRDPEDAGRPFELRDVGRVVLGHERAAEPVRVAEEPGSGIGSSRGSSCARDQTSIEPRSPGADSEVSSQSERSRMSGGMRVRHVCIGAPNTRTRRSLRCAATESPNGPAPITATSSRSATALTSV